MKRYVVTNTIQSRATGSTPADVTYYRGTDEGQALSALLSAATLRGAEGGNLPNDMQFDVTSVRLDIYELGDTQPELAHLSSAERAEYRRCTQPYCECGGALHDVVPDEEDGATDSTGFWTDADYHLSLSDCTWYDEPVAKRPWWAKGDCSGRVGETITGPRCEHHYNAAPKF